MFLDFDPRALSILRLQFHDASDEVQNKRFFQHLLRDGWNEKKRGGEVEIK